MKKVITLDVNSTLELDKYLSDNDLKGINKSPVIKRLSNIDPKHYATIKSISRSCQLVSVSLL